MATNVPNHPTGNIYPGYHNALVQTETVADIKAYRLLTYFAPNRGVVRRSLSYFFYMLMAILAAPFLPRVDVVVSTSPQFFCGLAGYFVSRIKRVPWVLEIRDLWPESIVAVGAMRDSLSIRLLFAMSNFAYRKADRIVCVTDSFRTAIMNEGISDEKIVVIKNGVDLDLFTPGRTAPDAGKTPGLEVVKNKFVVSYVGTHGMAHGLDTVLEAADMLRDLPQVVFLLVGDGAERDRLVRKCAMMRLTNVILMGQQPKDRMPAIWVATAVSLVLLKDEPLFRTVIPSKIFESMAMMKPVILGVRGESAALLEDSGAGICIQPESALQLARAVRQLLENPAQCEALGLAGRAYVEQNFDRTNLAERFEQLLAGLVAERRGLATTPERR